MLQGWLTELDGITEVGGVTNFTFHPQLIGRPSRFACLRELIEYARRTPRLWIAALDESAPTCGPAPDADPEGNLHAHTTFSGRRRPIDERDRRYRELGYDFLAITDHEDRIRDDYWFSIPAGDDRMLILPGIELNYGRCRSTWGR